MSSCRSLAHPRSVRTLAAVGLAALLSACCLFETDPEPDDPKTGSVGAEADTAVAEDGTAEHEDPPDVRGKARFKDLGEGPVIAEVEISETDKPKIKRVRLYAQREYPPASLGAPTTYEYPTTPDYEEDRPAGDPNPWYTTEVELPFAHVFNPADPDEAYIFLRVETFDAAYVLLGTYERDLLLGDKYFVDLIKK